MVQEIIAGVLIVLGAIVCLAATRQVVRLKDDGLSRSNAFGMVASVALPLFLVALFVAHPGTINDFVRLLVAIFGLWLVSAGGTFIMGRSLLALKGENLADPEPGVQYDEP